MPRGRLEIVGLDSELWRMTLFFENAISGIWLSDVVAYILLGDRVVGAEFLVAFSNGRVWIEREYF